MKFIRNRTRCFTQVCLCLYVIDDDLKYRSVDEINSWKKKDPLEISKKTIKKSKLNILKNFKKEIAKEIKEAFNYAKKSPFPNSKSAYEDVYG